jgi:DnaD/phage-associated family protein
MSKTILTNVHGFTPVIDSVVKDTSLITAVVFGKMWRYCQMENGVCQATIDKIAGGIGLSRQTIIDHIKILEDKKYILDTTPELRNRPHTYKDTGKAGLRLELSAVNLVDSAVNDVYSESQADVLEDSIKKEVKKESTTTSVSKEVFRTYQSEIGVITPHIADSISLWIDDPTCPNEWILDVMKIAADQNKRNWAYCEAILKRWMVEGKTAVKKEPVGPKYSNKREELFKQLENA